ncbi:MAG TPA: hypothetical protein VFO82_13790 [Steroidobacteraceae bacterium]|nr:hypothetical protein [Steroidobacteraceae bacterium]
MQHAGMLEAFSSGKGPEFRFEPDGNTFLINHTPFNVTYHGPFATGWIRLHCWDPGDELEGGSIK